MSILPTLPPTGCLSFPPAPWPPLRRRCFGLRGLHSLLSVTSSQSRKTLFPQDSHRPCPPPPVPAASRENLCVSTGRRSAHGRCLTLHGVRGRFPYSVARGGLWVCARAQRGPRDGHRGWAVAGRLPAFLQKDALELAREPKVAPVGCWVCSRRGRCGPECGARTAAGGAWPPSARGGVLALGSSAGLGCAVPRVRA